MKVQHDLSLPEVRCEYGTTLQLKSLALTVYRDAIPTYTHNLDLFAVELTQRRQISDFRMNSAD